ncbi:ABC transporter permease [Caloranaerobacter sp. TR13]|uniref:carbohydrate ABC transporter permease n=1 Tax=Caloranaerobacter sp. TR13 TaxID=1302151 RepID=UPI0006D3EB36|nr:sugar ABC transporter permease [Caloranaerobacter sp. TR13]KPU26895.1 ABC transporter permease [Caloranaerobacter sp. TR13]
MKQKNKLYKKLKKYEGYFFILPWILGMLLFTIGPILFAIYIGFTEWKILTKPNFVGFQNYIDIFHDENFWNSLMVTVKYAIFAVPLGIITSLTIAILMNTEIKGIRFFRTIYYLPAVVSGVAVALLWRWVLDPEFGLINLMLAQIGIQGPGWLSDPDWVLPSYILMALWGAGGGMITYLVGLREVPQNLYEAAEIDGAGPLTKFFKITLPLMTPILFYNLIMGIIGAFRKFTDAYILGGAGNQGKFYLVYLYDNAFKYFKMGYATALAWILFVIIFLLTLIIFKSSSLWVYYESNDD